ncbi:MAG: PEP-CTERM sorting domain-containing protein [Gemmatimonadetes bacterium]|nr:PEP-CTERM sorting domain-containing protein [Gemmatimonadota bacterium]
MMNVQHAAFTPAQGYVGIIVLIAYLTITSCTATKGATEAEFSFTFQSDAEGWTAGFADLPANFEPSIYELDSGYRPLPQGLEGNGLYIQGHNRSDDLFMFFKRRIDGLKADATYAVFASLDLATNVPSNLVGIGGSPGESVYVKAGASTVEPVAEGANLRLNIDKGNQSNGGASMVVLGNVAHPEVVGREFRLKSLDNADNPVNVTTDSKGGLWLIVGTDSGFEGLSTFYYARIAYTLKIVESSNSGASLLGPSNRSVD